jgi:LCP family protein required for cell wall assembly
MKQKLRVPAPPGYQSPSGRKRRRSGRKRAAVWSKRLPGCAAGCLAVLALLLASFAIWRYAPWAGILPLLSSGEGSRTNLLLLGIDRREGSGWAYRTDTIMVLTADPRNRTAGLLSIPRDLQLPIPTYGEDRINTANVYGYLQGYPGGGPALLEATIAANFGIPIDAYIMIDFQTFEKIVDTLGGIDVDVPVALHDTRYPDPRPGDPYAFKTVHFDPGRQHMDGKRALEYARSRMSTSDFDRARRQQLILLAIRQRALSLDAMPRWPALAVALVDGMQTDLSPGEVVDIAGLALATDPSNLKQVVLQHPLVYSYKRADGAAVELPNWDLITPVIHDLFALP